MKLFDCEQGDVVVFDNSIYYIKNTESFPEEQGRVRYFDLVSESGGLDWQEYLDSPHMTEVINLGKGECKTLISVPGVYATDTDFGPEPPTESALYHDESQDELYNFSPYIVASNSCER